VRLKPHTTAADRARVIATARRSSGSLYVIRLQQRPTRSTTTRRCGPRPPCSACCSAPWPPPHSASSDHAVQRRAVTSGVCAALGMTRRQVLGAVVVQAALVAGTALVIGMPLGIAAGAPRGAGSRPISESSTRSTPADDVAAGDPHRRGGGRRRRLRSCLRGVPAAARTNLRTDRRVPTRTTGR